jgi:pimeloyl-ACP methyl ester carboxylesterase
VRRARAQRPDSSQGFDWTRSVAAATDVSLQLFEGGEGPVVVMVHGWPDTHHLWSGVAALLAPRFRVVAYDTRGMGESGHPGSDEGFVLERLAEDLRAVIDAVSPDAPVHVLAHDWGSIQSWEAVCEPWAVDRIASFTSISGPNLDHVGRWLRRSVLPPTPRGVAQLVRQGVASSYIPALLSPLGPPLLRGLVGSRARWERFLEVTEGIRPAGRHHATTLPDDMVNGLAYYRANRSRVLRPRERRTEVPVMLIVPTRDRAVRSVSYEETARSTSHLRRRDLPYGHWVVLDRPDLVAGELTRFVDRLSVTS